MRSVSWRISRRSPQASDQTSASTTLRGEAAFNTNWRQPEVGQPRLAENGASTEGQIGNAQPFTRILSLSRAPSSRLKLSS